MRAAGPGFTLIEVLAAVLIVSLVFGLLLESVTRNLAALSRARSEARAMQLAEDRLRDLKADLASGTKLEDGVTDGSFDEPDQDMHWQIVVTPQTLALPPDYRGEVPPGPLFVSPAAAARQSPPPSLSQTPGSNAAGPQTPEEPLRLVEVRVFRQGDDPQSVEPFVLLVTAPPDTSQLGQSPTTNPSAPAGTGNPNALGSSTQPPASPALGGAMGTSP
ncbi:MAG TPA: type II secretion system protein [Myxococcota bacterium]|nr:type II secretion system protein [Myxococcota bacterium]